MAPLKPRTKARLRRKIAEEHLEASAAALERACRKIRETVGAAAEVRMAAQLGEEWIDVVLDDKEPVPTELPRLITAALHGFA